MPYNNAAKKAEITLLYKEAKIVFDGWLDREKLAAFIELHKAQQWVHWRKDAKLQMGYYLEVKLTQYWLTRRSRLELLSEWLANERLAIFCRETSEGEFCSEYKKMILQPMPKNPTLADLWCEDFSEDENLDNIQTFAKAWRNGSKELSVPMQVIKAVEKTLPKSTKNEDNENIAACNNDTLNFVAIDFETANFSPESACSIGIAVVKDGIVAETYTSLIKPPKEFSTFFKKCVNMHGITAEDVVDAPNFAEIWEKISSLIGNSVIVAHNASFDCNVLFKTLAFYGIPAPKYEVVCTLGVARSYMPKMSKHTLDVVSEKMGIVLNHHEATSDAVAAAEIVIRTCRELEVSGIKQMLDKIGFKLGYASGDEIAIPEVKKFCSNKGWFYAKKKRG